MRSIIVLLLIFLLSSLSFGQHEQYKSERFIMDSDTLLYRILWPKNFDISKSYPLILFLHGAGERGSDNQKQLTHGASMFEEELLRADYPAIVIFPQCPADSYWASVEIDRTIKPFKIDFKMDEGPTKPLAMVFSLLNSYIKRDYIDTSKVYIGGLSMGGMGTFEMLYRHPETFAAGFAICGAAEPKTARSYANKVPLWIFHGAKDDIVDPKFSLDMAKAILEHGGFPRVTIYEDANHNSWDSAFAEPTLMYWLFNHQKE